jgi:O-antigen ligase
MRARRQLLTSSQRGTAICIGLLSYLILAGGTPGGEFNGWVRALNGAIAALLIVLWTRALPTDNDSTDRWMTWALLLFLVTGTVSIFPRQSFDAAIQATAVAGAFYLARRKMAGDGHAIIEAALAWLGIGISLVIVLVWALGWLDWLQVSGGAFPPLNRPLVTGPFGHPHDVALLVCLLAPALWSPAFHQRRTIRIIGTALVAVVVVVESSRNVELAVVLASVVIVLATRLRPSVRRARLATGLGLAAGLVAAVIIITSPEFVARVTNVKTILSRITLWTDAASVWLSHPLAGIGPGAFPFSYMLTDHFTFSAFDPRHPDNAVVQLLVEGGIIGLAAGLACVVGLANAARKRYRVQPRAAWALLVFGFASLGANPTDFIFLITPAALWAAILLPPDPVAGVGPTTVRTRRGAGLRVTSRFLAVVVASAIAVTGVASIFYEVGRSAYLRGDANLAAAAVDLAANLDPSLSIYQREGASLAFARGAWRVAADDYRRALATMPYDPLAWRGLALALLADSNIPAAASAAGEAVRLIYMSPENQLVLAAATAKNDPIASRAAFREALNEAPQLAVISWQRTIVESVAQVDTVRLAADARPTNGEPFLRMGQMILTLIVNRPDVAAAAAMRISPLDHSAESLAAIGVCNFAQGARVIELASRTERELGSFWLAWPLVADAVGSGQSESAALSIRYLGLSGGPGPASTSALAGNDSDSWRFRRLSLGVLAQGAMLPSTRAGLWILLTDPATAVASYGSGWPPGCPGPSVH